jgi:hypothetical protein
MYSRSESKDLCLIPFKGDTLKKEHKSILFLMGPSGVGKSTLAGWIAKDLGLLHIEIDRFPEGDGIDLEGLRTEWDAFWNGRNMGPITSTLLTRASSADCSGVILSFPSGVVPSSEHLEAAEKARVRVIVLYGTGAECLGSFLRRELASGRNLSVEHWIQNNALYYARFSEPRFAAHRLLVFERGEFQDRRKLVAKVKNLLAQLMRQS